MYAIRSYYESRVQAALAKIVQTDCVVGQPVLIRIEDDDTE